MNKKILGVALLSLSVMTFSACSSDDDDDMVDAGTTDAMTADAGAADAGADAGAADAGADAGAADAGADAGAADSGATDAGTDSGATDAGADAGSTDAGLTPAGYIPGTLTALVEANGGTQALAALKAENLDLSLNDVNNNWTVFLPTDAAIAAHTGTVDVRAHIYVDGPVSSAQAVGLSGSSITMNAGNTVAIAGGDATTPLTIGGAGVVTPDLMVAPGALVVHMIDAVIVP